MCNMATPQPCNLQTHSEHSEVKEMKTKMTCAVAGVSALLCMQAAQADVVQMKNGDRISGKVTAMAGDKMTISTSYGDVAVKWSEVANLATDATTEIMLDDKTVLSGKVSGGSAGTLNVTSNEIVQSAPIALSRVSYINPPSEVTGRGLKLHARVNAGAARTTGNTDTQSIHLDGEAWRAASKPVYRGRALQRIQGQRVGDRQQHHGLHEVRPIL